MILSKNIISLTHLLPSMLHLNDLVMKKSSSLNTANFKNYLLVVKQYILKKAKPTFLSCKLYYAAVMIHAPNEICNNIRELFFL